MADCYMMNIIDNPLNIDLISEEKRPSLYSFSSMTESICSDSTIDLDDFDQNLSSIPDSNAHKIRNSKPLKNNFLSEKETEFPTNKRFSEVEGHEPSIKPVKTSHPVFSKSVSMHDVSNIFSLNLTAKSNTVSCETINSQSLSSTTKSKDSGFQRSLSCLSITSGRRNYDHVESKVKAYIKNIKESEALNKKNKLLKTQEKINEPIVLVSSSKDLMEKDDLIKEIQDLKHELHEKSMYIDAQQRNYNKLLLKFAEARNLIDTLRVQSMSYNICSDEDESKHANLSGSNIISNTIHNRISKNFKYSDSCLIEEEALETANEILTDNFSPCGHSSPYEKSLSPIRKIFSSSLHLDKKYQPLTNLKTNTVQLESHKTTQNRIKETLGNNNVVVNKNNCAQLNNSNLLQRQSSSIDLPNDDPFDKVKKWQASLPSINLLGSCSSSDCEDAELKMPCCTSFVSAKINENNSSTHFPKIKTNDSEICNILSEELQNKCIITEIDIDTDSRVMKPKNNQECDNKCKKDEDINILERTDQAKELSSNIKNKLSSRKSLEQNQMYKSKASYKRENLVGVVLPSSDHENKPKSCKKESSLSESLSSYLPKSTSVSCCRVNNLENDISDDCSSISSSVLGSNNSSSIESHKRAKRRLILCEDQMLNKVPKTTQSRSSETNFVLKKPKLNFIPDFESNGKSQMISENRKKNCEQISSGNSGSMNSLVFTESSQRRAWKARNNENFYVCKDFTFSKNVSLTECIKDMEGLVLKGAFYLRSVVNRNNVAC